MTKIKTTRLTSNHRVLLSELAARIVDCPAEINAEDAAYKKALPIALKVVHAQFPVADMVVLAKYKCAQPDSCAKIRHPDMSMTGFNFRKDDVPTVPGNGWDYRSHIYLTDEKQQKVIEAWADAALKLADCTKQKHNDYRALIASAATFEQVVEIWPEAEQLADLIKTNLPSTISPEMLARIKADSAARMKRSK